MGKGIPRLDLQFCSLNGMVNLGYWAEPRRQKIRAPEVTVKSFKGMRRMWARVAREGHLEEGTFKGSFKHGVALARARQGG